MAEGDTEQDVDPALARTMASGDIPRTHAPATDVAKDVAFQAPSGTATAGSAFDIDFVNQDGFPHNVELVDAGGNKVFSGDMVSGGEVTYHVTALSPGTYHVKCVVHPDMDQTLTVK